MGIWTRKNENKELLETELEVTTSDLICYVIPSIIMSVTEEIRRVSLRPL